jgi:hypothetical protein
MCAGLTWTGVGFEVVGLGLVAVELTRVQRRELGPWRWTRRVRAWLPRRTATRHTQPAELAGHLRGSSSMWGELTTGPTQVPTIDERVASLEANLDALRDQADQRQAAMEQRLTTVSSRVDEVRADVDRQHAEREAERREQLRESVTLQWWGTGLFVIGAILGGLANVTC